MFFFFAKQETSGKYFSPDSDSIRGEELATRWSLAGFSFINNKCAFSPLAGFFSVVFLIYKCASPNHRCLLSVPASTPRLSFSCVSAPITRDHGFHFVQIRIRCLARSLLTRWPFTVSPWQSFSGGFRGLLCNLLFSVLSLFCFTCSFLSIGNMAEAVTLCLSKNRLAKQPSSTSSLLSASPGWLGSSCRPWQLLLLMRRSRRQQLPTRNMLLAEIKEIWLAAWSIL